MPAVVAALVAGSDGVGPSWQVVAHTDGTAKGSKQGHLVRRTAVGRKQLVDHNDRPWRHLKEHTVPVDTTWRAGAAAVVGGAALIGVGAPVIAVAAGAAVVGVGVGLAAEYAYENWVSDETREKIDDGLEAVGDAITFWD